MKGKILIAVPTFENIKPECYKSIYNLKNPKDYLLYFDYVLMIDSDVNVPRQTVNKLLECETDIALGWYYKKRTTTDQTVIYDFGKDYTDKNMIYGETLWKANNPFDIKGGGLGIALVNVNVFRKMPYPYFKYVIYGNDTVLSEDLYFCTEARKYGMNIKCNPDVKGNHIYEVSV